jgi:hypothetical protein
LLLKLNSVYNCSIIASIGRRGREFLSGVGALIFATKGSEMVSKKRAQGKARKAAKAAKAEAKKKEDSEQQGEANLKRRLGGCRSMTLCVNMEIIHPKLTSAS